MANYYFYNQGGPVSAIVQDVAGVNLTDVFVQINNTRDQAINVSHLRLPGSLTDADAARTQRLDRAAAQWALMLRAERGSSARSAALAVSGSCDVLSSRHMTSPPWT